jgi:hypothetical protein
MASIAEDQKTLEKLKAELDFIENGGYRPAGDVSWMQPAIFLESPTCLNFGHPYRSHSCAECVLMQFVPDERRKAMIPCHHIPLTAAGDTIESAEGWADQIELEDFLKDWLQRTIRQLEAAVDDNRQEKPPACEAHTSS